MSDAAPLFVVGTGRCGSTLVSELVRAHPSLLSLSELFMSLTDLGGRIAECFPEAAIDASEFGRIIAGVPPKLTTMLRHDVAMQEVLYRPGSQPSGSRFASGVPAILQTTLPHLSDEPELILAELERFIATRPRARVGEHYRALFAWLCQRLDRQRWVERSGGSLRIVGRLLTHFPDARFVHLVRDGRNCALSISQHLGFRMALIAIQLTEILGVDPWESSDRSNEGDLPDELIPFLPEGFDREAFLAYATPLPLCGHYWSGEVLAGLAELARVDADRVLTLRYEDFGTAPHATIARLFDFFEVRCEPAWIDRMAAIVRPARSRWTELAPRELDQLREACAPGFAALTGLYSD